MLAFLALLPRALVTFLYALSALLRFFTPSLAVDELGFPPSSNEPTPIKRNLPCWVGASRPFTWPQRLSWLLSALSGTVELELETAQIYDEIERHDAVVRQLASKSRSQDSCLNPDCPAAKS
jgi:hypothetical protein